MLEFKPHTDLAVHSCAVQFNLRETSNIIGNLCRMTKEVHKQPVQVGSILFMRLLPRLLPGISANSCTFPAGKAHVQTGNHP